MKSGKLNFLEPSGPLQACNGTALPCLLNKSLALMGIPRGQGVKIYRRFGSLAGSVIWVSGTDKMS